MTHHQLVPSATDPVPLATRQRQNVRFGAWLLPRGLTPGIPFFDFSIGRLRREMCRCGGSWPAPSDPWRRAPVVVCLSDVGDRRRTSRPRSPHKNPRLGKKFANYALQLKANRRRYLAPRVPSWGLSNAGPRCARIGPHRPAFETLYHAGSSPLPREEPVWDQEELFLVCG